MSGEDERCEEIDMMSMGRIVSDQCHSMQSRVWFGELCR